VFSFQLVQSFKDNGLARRARRVHRDRHGARPTRRPRWDGHHAGERNARVGGAAAVIFALAGYAVFAIVQAGYLSSSLPTCA